MAIYKLRYYNSKCWRTKTWIYAHWFLSVTIDLFFTDRGLIDENGIPVLNISRIREDDFVPHYIKLHGSIDWWLTDQQKVIAILLDQITHLKFWLTEQSFIRSMKDMSTKTHSLHCMNALKKNIQRRHCCCYWIFLQRRNNQQYILRLARI